MSASQDALFKDYHRLLFPIAKNLLKNSEDAEDLVQETMLKWLSLETKQIENPKGYLVKTLINKCLNFLRDRKRKGEGYDVEIAPELLVDHLPRLIEKGTSLSLSFLMMLEKLNAIERAVFLLKEIFGYSHKEISALLEISEENSRQILARAKRHLKSKNSRFEVDPIHHDELYQTFIEVCEGKDLQKLIHILKEDISIHVNGNPGIKRPAAAAHWLFDHFAQADSWTIYAHMGTPFITLFFQGQPMAQIWLACENGLISKIFLKELIKEKLSV